MNDPQPRTPRPCGGCTLCCVATAVPSLEKPCGVACPKLGPQGCTIHDHRADPKYAICISFQCLWSQGWAEEGDRPDKIGALFGLEDDPDRAGEHRFRVMEARPGAAEHPRIQEIARHMLANGMPVVIANADFSTGIRPNGDAWRYVVDPRDPLRSRIDATQQPLRIMTAFHAHARTAGGPPVNIFQPL